MREWLVFALLVLCGCGGLRVNLVDGGARPPSSVAMYLSVDTDEGEPVRGLEASSFQIYEDGELRDSGPALLDPALAAAHHTLLLLDMSGSESAQQELPLIAEAARDFLSALPRSQRVAVYAFDGSPSLHRIQGFSSAPKLERTLKRLEEFRTKNPSANMHAAVLEGKRVLSQSLEKAKQPLRFGTLVVYVERAQGRAQAPLAQRDQASAGNGVSVFAVGAGRGIDDVALSSLGVNGYVHVADKGALPRAMRTVGNRIADFTNSYYLLSYCSAGRPGQHELKIRVVDPRSGAKGSLRYAFDGKNFRPAQCKAGARPRFSRSRAERGTVRGSGTRGLPLPIQNSTADLDAAADPEIGMVSAPDSGDPELGEVSTPGAQAAPVEQGPPQLDMEALDNELPPGLKPKSDEDEDEDEDD